MLGSPDLLTLSSRRERRAESGLLGTFDYDDIRRELDESRAIKYQTDRILSQYLKASEKASKMAKRPEPQSNGSARLDTSDEDERLLPKTSRSAPQEKRRRRKGKANSTARNTTKPRPKRKMGRSKVIMERPLPTKKKEKDELARQAAQRKQQAAQLAKKRTNPNAGSPGTANRLFVSKKSWIRPAELDCIRTVPKPEVQIIQRSGRRRPKQAPTEVLDMRTKAYDAQFVSVSGRDRSDRGLARRERDSERILGLSSVSQRLTIHAESDETHLQSRQASRLQGPSPRMLRPEPVAKSRSPVATVLPQEQQNLGAATPTLLKQSPPKSVGDALASAVAAVEPQVETSPVHPVQEIASRSKPLAMPSSTLEASEEMIRQLQAKTALLETTNEALKSQLLNTESRSIETERRERAVRAARTQEAEEQKRMAAETEMAKQRMEDALKAKNDAFSMVETLKDANTTLQKGCEVLQEQVVAHQKRADNADMTAVQLREEQYQKNVQRQNTQRTVALSQVSAHNFDDLCSLLVAELCYENLAPPTKGPPASSLRPEKPSFERTKPAPTARVLHQTADVYKALPTANEDTAPVAAEVSNEENSEDDYDEDYENEFEDDDASKLSKEESAVANTTPADAPTALPVVDQSKFVNDAFVLRLQGELEQLRQNVNKNAEFEKQAYEERMKREVMEEKMRFVKDREGLMLRLGEAEAKALRGEQQEEHIKELHRAIQQSTTLQQRLEEEERRRVEAENVLRRTEIEKLKLQEKLNEEAKRADSFALAATAAVASQPLDAPRSPVPKPGGARLKQVIPAVASDEAERVESKAVATEEPVSTGDREEPIVQADNEGGVSEKVDESQEEEEVVIDEGPRTYTILYARPNDRRLTGEDSILSDTALEESHNSNYNSLLSDYSFGANSDRNMSSDDSLLDDYSSAAGEMNDSSSSLLSVSKIKTAAFANWGGPKEGSSLDEKDVSAILHDANRSVLEEVLEEVIV